MKGPVTAVHSRGRGALDGDSRDLVYLVDRLRADLASGWERPQKVL